MWTLKLSIFFLLLEKILKMRAIFFKKAFSFSCDDTASTYSFFLSGYAHSSEWSGWEMVLLSMDARIGCYGSGAKGGEAEDHNNTVLFLFWHVCSLLNGSETVLAQGIDMDWWSHSQLISRYGKDKQQGFYVDNTPFDRILLDSKDKHIKALYNFCIIFWYPGWGG